MSLSSLLGQERPVAPSLMIRLDAFLAQVETELWGQVGSSIELVEAVGSVTLGSGGKRIRPVLAYVSALATGLPVDEGRVRRVGACLELIHMATLIHDDVIDQAVTRRNHPTAASLHGNTAAILGGDVLLAKSMRILAMDGDLALIRAVSSAVVEMAEGEVLEIGVRGRFDIDEQEHREVLRKKTASFTQVCCEAGALLTGASNEGLKALGQFGHHLGMAFQITDDILDYVGDPRLTGKPNATDFRDAQATLPLIFLRSSLSGEESSFTRKKFGNGVSDDDIAMIRAWMQTRGAIGQAKEEAETHAALALQALDVLPGSDAKDLLASLARFAVDRCQ
jgi:octaprenyl-diphosphate synthase